MSLYVNKSSMTMTINVLFIFQKCLLWCSYCS